MLARMNGREPVHHDNMRARAKRERWVLHKAGRRYYAQVLSSHADTHLLSHARFFVELAIGAELLNCRSVAKSPNEEPQVINGARPA